jgi:hypothetical protein
MDPYTSLDALDPRFKPIAMELLARFVEARIPVFIINTRRTPAQQAAAIASGHSWVQHSKHLDGLAIDVCPLQQYSLHGPVKLDWNASDPIWEQMAQLAEALDLRCGYRWKQRDCGHYEFVEPVQATRPLTEDVDPSVEVGA